MIKKDKRVIFKRTLGSKDDLIQNVVHLHRVLVLTAVDPSISNTRGVVSVGRP